MTDTSYLYKYFLEKSPGKKEIEKSSADSRSPEIENVRETKKEDKKHE